MWEVALQHCQENLEPRDLFPLLCASKATFQRLTAGGLLRPTHVTSRVALSPVWPHRICPSCIETVVLHTAAPRSFYESLPKLRSVSWCMANPIWSSDLPRPSPTFMLPGLPRMMLYLDLIRRGSKTFVTLQVERLDHDSAVLPLFLSVSLRKQLPSSEPEFGKVRHGHGDVARRELEKALSLAYLQSLQRHEAVMMVLPAESSSYGGIEQFTEMVEAAKWEVHFAATAASQEELGCLQVKSDTATWRVGNAKKVLNCGGVSSEPFSLSGLRGTWTMDLKSSSAPVLSLWPPPAPRSGPPVHYQLELGNCGLRTLVQCSLIPGFEATFPLDLSMVDQHGALQIRLKLLHSERSEGFAVFPDGDHSCLLMWRLGQVQRFLDASALIVSSPAFCMRDDDNWEGCLWITSELGRGLHLQLRWPKPQGFQLGKQQLSGKVGASEWTDAQGEAWEQF